VIRTLGSNQRKGDQRKEKWRTRVLAAVWKRKAWRGITEKEETTEVMIAAVEQWRKRSCMKKSRVMIEERKKKSEKRRKQERQRYNFRYSEESFSIVEIAEFLIWSVI
jgi:cytidylate kinase